MEEFTIPSRNVIDIKDIDEEYKNSSQYVSNELRSNRSPKLTRMEQLKSGRRWCIIIQSGEISALEPEIRRKLEKQLSRYCNVGICSHPNEKIGNTSEYIGLLGQHQVKDEIISWLTGTANTKSKSFKKAIKDESPIFFGQVELRDIVTCNFDAI